jgi:hypothetical protein
MTAAQWVDDVGPHSTADDVAPILDDRETDEAHILRLLRKRDLPATVIECVSRHERWNGRHAIRTAIVMHIKTPRTLSLRLLGLLRWRDQLRVAVNLRLPMTLRTAAEGRLKERYPELELGEKISLARTAPTGLVPQLATENEARVIGALLNNPRLIEMDVIGLIRRDETASEVLRVVAQSERWINRPSIRLGLIRHPRTPVHMALRLVDRLSLPEIRKLVAKRHELPRVVLLACERILAGDRRSTR